MADAMPSSREAAPKVVPAAPVTGPTATSVISPTQPEPDIYEMMRAYDAANEAYCASLRTVDSVVIGREPAEDEIAANQMREERFRVAEIEFCAYVPRTIEESRAKVAFMAERNKRGHFDLCDDTYAAFLGSVGSMARAVPENEPLESELSFCLDRWLALMIEGAKVALSQAKVDEIRNLEHRMVPLQPKTLREAYGKVAVWRGILPYGVDGGEHGAFELVMPAEISRIVGISLEPAPAPDDPEEPAGAAAQSVEQPSADPASVDCKFLALHHEWYELRVASNRHAAIDGRIITDEEMEILFYRRSDEIEDEITATPGETAADAAVKALVAHGYGDHSCLDFENDPFWQEARRLVGFPLSPLAASRDPSFLLTVPSVKRRAWWGEWLGLGGASNTMTDEEHEVRVRELVDRVDDVLAAPAENMQDLAMKVVIDTRAGDFGIEPAMLAELHAVSGLPAETSLPKAA